jgi:hypothetical protein
MARGGVGLKPLAQLFRALSATNKSPQRSYLEPLAQLFRALSATNKSP